MKASQKDTSNSAAESRRERERLREEKEMQRMMGASGSTSVIMSASVSVKPISLAPKPGFKKISTIAGSVSGGGWKTVGASSKRSEAELSWGNNGDDEYDPAYPTPP